MSKKIEIRILRRKIRNLQKQIERQQKLINRSNDRFEKLLSKTTSPEYRQQLISNLNTLKTQAGGQLQLNIIRTNQEIAELQNQIRILEGAN